MEEGEVVVGLALAAGGDAPFCFQPGVGAFDGPAVAGLRVGACAAVGVCLATPRGCWCAVRDRLACSARLGDARLDLALAQCLLERGRGVAAVCPQLPGPDPLARASASTSGSSWRRSFSLPAATLHLQRRAARVCGQVVAAARPAQERARDLLAPFFASTSEASTITRDQSSSVRPGQLACSSPKSLQRAAPAADHSSRRRLHVSPLGSPNSR